GLQQAEDQFEDDRFARAARSQQQPHAPLRNFKAHIAQDEQIVESERDMVEHDGALVASRVGGAVGLNGNLIGVLHRGPTGTLDGFEIERSLALHWISEVEQLSSSYQDVRVAT